MSHALHPRVLRLQGARSAAVVLTFMLAMLSLGACDDEEQPEQLPCSHLFGDILPERVDLYDWNGQQVYVFEPQCCDQFVEVYSLECTYLCAPAGGIAGDGDGMCPEFFDEAVFLETLFENKT